MLKDLADSKRVNGNIKALPVEVSSPVRGRRRDAADIVPLSATIISALFWPPLQQEPLRLPKEVCYRAHKV